MRFGLPHLMLCASMLVLMFSNDEAHAVEVQVTGVCFFILSSIGFALTRANNKIVIGQFDIVMIFTVICSYIASILTGDYYVLFYTTVFLLTYISAMRIAHQTIEMDLFICIQVSAALILGAVLVLHGDFLLTALAPGALRRWELREAPFGMHPNLAGFVYGGIVVMIANTRFAFSKWNMVIKFAIILLCLAVMAAASARGGLLAVALTLFVYLAGNLKNIKRATIYLALCVPLATLCGFFFRDSIYAYAWEMLDFDSPTRGLSSGGTGRIELWQRGIDYIFERDWQFFLGSGLRSATFSNLGFLTESSYINIAIESGVYVTAIFIIIYIKLLMFSYHRQKKGAGLFRLAYYTLIFAMFQSIFNRYLIAIGNPFSLFILLLLSRLSMEAAGGCRRAKWAEMKSSGRSRRLKSSLPQTPPLGCLAARNAECSIRSGAAIHVERQSYT